MKIFAFIMATVLLVLPATSAKAGTVCDQQGKSGCFSLQIVYGKTNQNVLRQVQARPNNSGSTVLSAIRNGQTTVAGSTCMYLYLWLKPEAKRAAESGSWRMPAERVRQFNYHDVHSNPQAVRANFVTNKSSVPEISHPRLTRWSKPTYVLQGNGGAAGIGWSLPTEVLDRLFLAMECPCSAVSTFPNRVTANEGMIILPEELRAMQRSHNGDGLSGFLFR